MPDQWMEPSVTIPDLPAAFPLRAQVLNTEQA